MIKKEAIIFDIDGTLADCSHRLHHIQGENKDWDAFYEGMGDDKPLEMAFNFLLYALERDDCDVLLVTGRPQKHFDETRKWLKNQIGSSITKFMPLLMRPDGDFRPDHVVKKEIYHNHIQLHYDVKLVLEDRDGPVKMWRELGIECWQVRNGAY